MVVSGGKARDALRNAQSRGIGLTVTGEDRRAIGADGRGEAAVVAEDGIGGHVAGMAGSAGCPTRCSERVEAGEDSIIGGNECGERSKTDESGSHDAVKTTGPRLCALARQEVRLRLSLIAYDPGTCGI